MAQTQWWISTQKLRFVSDVSGTHICVHNPTTYNFIPLTKASAGVPLQAARNIFNGGTEFSPGAIPLEWPEMDYSEWLDLQPYFYTPSVMIDMYDNGFDGWLVPGSYEPPAGVATKVGKAKANFIVKGPADGLTSTVNKIAAPGALTATVGAAGSGSLGASTTLYYALTFWSNWGESLMSPIKTVNTGATANTSIQISWTAPTSSFYRKARLYIATSTFTSGTIQSVKAEVYQAFTQSWLDTCGTSGVTSTATTPTENEAWTGLWKGGVWQNG